MVCRVNVPVLLASCVAGPATVTVTPFLLHGPVSLMCWMFVWSLSVRFLMIVIAQPALVPVDLFTICIWIWLSWSGIRLLEFHSVKDSACCSDWVSSKLSDDTHIAVLRIERYATFSWRRLLLDIHPGLMYESVVDVWTTVLVFHATSQKDPVH